MIASRNHCTTISAVALTTEQSGVIITIMSVLWKRVLTDAWDESELSDLKNRNNFFYLDIDDMYIQPRMNENECEHISILFFLVTHSLLLSKYTHTRFFFFFSYFHQFFIVIISIFSLFCTFHPKKKNIYTKHNIPSTPQKHNAEL